MTKIVLNGALLSGTGVAPIKGVPKQGKFMIKTEIAKAYLKAGLSVLPANRATKCPLDKWKEYQTHLPTENEIEAWFANRHDAICIVCGKVSGNLEVIDFDNHGELFPKWKESIPADLLEKLVIEQTPSGGFHVAYRLAEEPCGNIKLAQGERDGKMMTLIETRAEGGLVLCAPTEGYKLQQGDYEALSCLTKDERETLLYAAWHLDERPRHTPQEQGYGKITDDDGGVDLSAFLENMNIAVAETVTPDEPKILRPWDVVTDEHVAEALEDTILGDLCGYFACATIPPLPLEAAILKAIVSAACALSEKASPDSLSAKGNLLCTIGRGPQLARLMIDTAGGQVCNAYTMTVGNSASGKDIGNLLGIAMDHYNWSLGTSGSAEGILDALVKTPNGLQVISEMKNWLDAKHYLSKAADMFTEMFSKGHFKYPLSQRNGSFERESDYAYPNVYANIQPDVFEKNVKQTDVTSGLLGRFLMTLMPEFYGRPANFDLMHTLTGIIVCLDMFRRKSGVVKVPPLYLDDTAKMFAIKSPKNLAPSWRRLVNEYSPRFAVMLSITHDPATQGEQVILTDRCWRGAETMVLWFFAHAEKLLVNIMDIGEVAKSRESMYCRLLKVSGAAESDLHRAGETPRQDVPRRAQGDPRP